MTADRDSLYSAYLDGELSAAEASAFDKELTPEDRRRLAAEMRLESTIGDALCRGADCPDAVWDRVQHQVAAHRRASRAQRSRAIRNGMYAAAAAILLVLTGAYAWYEGYVPQNGTPGFLSTEGETVGTLWATSATSTDLNEIQAFLDSHKVKISVMHLEGGRVGHGGKTQLIGAREEHYRGEPVVELLFECCGKPLRVVMAKKGGAAAQAIGTATGCSGKGDVQASQQIDDLVIALVGTHRSKNVLEFIRTIGDNAVGQSV